MKYMQFMQHLKWPSRDIKRLARTLDFGFYVSVITNMILYCLIVICEINFVKRVLNMSVNKLYTLQGSVLLISLIIYYNFQTLFIKKKITSYICRWETKIQNIIIDLGKTHLNNFTTTELIEINNFEPFEKLLIQLFIELPRLIVYTCNILYYFSLMSFALLACMILIIMLISGTSLINTDNIILDNKNKLYERISNVNRIKSCCAEKKEEQYIADENDKKIKNKLCSNNIQFINELLFNLVKILTALACFLLKLNDTEFSSTDIIILAFADYFFFSCVEDIGKIIGNWKRNYPKLKQIYNIIDKHSKKHSLDDLLEDDLEYLQVLFSNFEKIKVVVKNNFTAGIPIFSLTFKNHHINYVVGNNGYGKSSILNSFFDSSNVYEKIGSFTVDLDEIDEDAVKRYVGIMLQDSQLFSGTVYDNVLYGVTNDIYKTYKIIKDIGMGTWLNKNGDKQIGFRGELISKGEQQIIQLINLFLRDKPILMLDEPYQHLDEQNKLWAKNVINKLSQTKCIVIFSVSSDHNHVATQ